MSESKGKMAAAFKGPIHDNSELPPPESQLDPELLRVTIPGSDDDRQIVTQQERQNLIRGLSQRHVQMIAIAGAIVCE
jgi:amino acid transporter